VRFWLATLVRWPLKVTLPLLYSMRTLGRENVPEGGAILASNHMSYADPIAVWTASPRPCRYMGKAELFEKGIVAWASPRLGAFPVHRGAADREAIATATATLAEGGLLGMFPQGTRVKEGEEVEAQGGVAFIALRADVPVVPVGVVGTDLIKPPGSRGVHFPRILVSFGHPIYPSDFTGSRRERVDAMTARIMEGITEERERALEARKAR
jgi:1-acyl-sn-glycerol-3-phosphate acyltransferase